MAKTNKARVGKSSKSTKVSNNKSQSGSVSLKWLSKFSQTQIIVALVFILAFTGVGAYHVYKSSAAPWLCVQHYYYEYEPGTIGGGCVYQIQYSINALSHLYHGTWAGADGVYGPVTKSQVIQFQNWHTASIGKQTPDGVVGNGTWIKLCQTLKNYGYGSQANADGCNANVNIYTYGAYAADLVTVPRIPVAAEHLLGK